jgi:hypothetical protein
VGNRTLEVDDETDREIQQPLLEASDIVSPPHAPQGNAIIFSRYVEASYAVNAVILARLTRMYERDDWARAVQRADEQGRRPRLYTRHMAQKKGDSHAKNDDRNTASGANGSGRPTGAAVTVAADGPANGHPDDTGSPEADTEQGHQEDESRAVDDSDPRPDVASEADVQPIDEMLNLTPSSGSDENQPEESHPAKADESTDRTALSAAVLAEQLDAKEDKRVMDIRPNERWHINTERTSS